MGAFTRFYRLFVSRKWVKLIEHGRTKGWHWKDKLGKVPARWA